MLHLTTLTMNNKYAKDFDLSSITLKEATEVQDRNAEDRRVNRESMKCQASQASHKERAEVDMRHHVYGEFIAEVIRLKIIDEMNERYFGKIIPLNIEREKQELPIAEAVEVDDDEPVKYEPLFPILDPTK